MSCYFKTLLFVNAVLEQMNSADKTISVGLFFKIHLLYFQPHVVLVVTGYKLCELFALLELNIMIVRPQAGLIFRLIQKQSCLGLRSLIPPRISHMVSLSISHTTQITPGQTTNLNIGLKPFTHASGVRRLCRSFQYYPK